MENTDNNNDPLESLGIDYRELFLSEIMKYTPADMKFAIEKHLDISNGVLKRLDAYNDTLKIVKPIIRTFWGRLAYIFDNPDVLVNYLFNKRPELKIEGAEAYVKEQIQKTGYAMVDWLSPNEKVKVKLDKKKEKFQKKMDK